MQTHRILLALFLISLTASSLDATAQSGDGTSSGTSRAFNPAISLNGLFLGVVSDAPHMDGHEEEDHEHHGALEEGLMLQETELRLSADIDAYSKADATFAYHEGEFLLEEIFVDSHALPAGFGLRAGLFYVPLSRENTTHTHQLPFATRSLAQSELFGEGWAEVGVLASWLAPMDNYLELRAGAFDGEQETWFGSEDGQELTYHFGAASLLELSDSFALELDVAGVTGANGAGQGTRTQMASVGTRLTWDPPRAAHLRARLAAEYIGVDREGGVDDAGVSQAAAQSGVNATAQLQVSRRWWASAGLEQWNPRGGGVRLRTRGGIAFVPTEFQALRLELARTDAEDPDAETVTEAFLQYNFTIGSHPAHRY